MDFAVLRTQRETKKRVQNTLTLLPLLRYKETDLGMISEFLEFERLAHLIRNLDGQFSLSKADHNVPYHWTVALPTQGKMKNVMKLYPEEQATLWRVQVLDCMLLRECFPVIDCKVLDSLDVVLQFQVSTDRDEPVETDAEGRLARRAYVSEGCSYMFRTMLQYQSRNMDATVIQLMEQYCTPCYLFTQRRLARYSGLDRIITVLSQLPGRKILFLSDPVGDDAEILDGYGRLQGLVWVAPWASMLTKGTHREVDCSFKALRPYTYYVPVAVLGNTGLPCGLSVLPTECADIFQQYEDSLPWKPLVPVLSDMGPAIKTFCNNNGLEQHFCHRHILESVGANSIAGRLMRDFLSHLTVADTERHMPQFASDVALFYNSGRISKDQLDKIERYTGIYFKENDGELTGSISHVDAGKRASCIIGLRRGVSRCSNHCEALHMHFNRNRRPNTSLTTKLRSIVRAILINVSRYNGRLDERLSDKLHQYSTRYRGQSVSEVCSCDECTRNKLMYQTNQGFCRHTCGTTKVSVCTALYLTPDAHTIPTTPVEFVRVETIHELHNRTDNQESNAAVSTASEEAGSYWAPVPGLIRSLAFLLDCDCDYAGFVLMEWLHDNRIDFLELIQMDPADLSRLKFQILADTTP